MCETHRWRRTWSELDYRRYHDADEFFGWLEGQISASRRIHVYSPNVMHDAMMMGFWERIERIGAVHETKETLRKIKPSRPRRPRATLETVGTAPVTPPAAVDPTYYIRSVVESATCSILRYRTRGRSYLWASHSQYVTCSEDEIAAAIRYDACDPEHATRGTRDRLRTPMERCLLWAKFHSGLADWWEANDGGPWGPTVAACAMSYLRRRLQPQTLLHHGIPEVALLEESAIYGGRRSVWYWGNVGTEHDWREHGIDPPPRSPHGTLGGGMTHHDIRSMYPFLLATMPYPVRWIVTKRSPSVASLAATLEEYGAIATVTIRSDRDDYPLRTPSGVRWPVVQYTTTLAGPELQHALACGRIREVQSAAVYQLGYPFGATCDSLLQHRQHYRSEGVPAMEVWSKALANAMSGKLAQRDIQWAPRPETCPPYQWGHWTRLEADTGLYRTYRTLAGVTWERVAAEGRQRPMAACYAYLTSYGRWLMGLIRSLLPPQSVLAMDTDGIWTRSEVVPLLYPDGVQDAAEAGALRTVTAVRCGRFFGPQHYWWGSGWVMSGMHRPKLSADGTRAMVEETCSLLWSVRHTPEPCVLVRDKEVSIDRMQIHGHVDDRGWERPGRITPDDWERRYREMGGFEWVD